MEEKSPKKVRNTKEKQKTGEHTPKKGGKGKKYHTKRYRDNNYKRRKDEWDNESDVPDDNIPSYKHWKSYIHERDETVNSILEKTLLNVFVLIENKKKKERTKNIRIPVFKKYEMNKKKSTEKEKELLSINEQIDVVSETLVTVSLYNIIIEEMHSSMVVREAMIKASNPDITSDTVKKKEKSPKITKQKQCYKNKNVPPNSEVKSSNTSLYPMNLLVSWLQKMQYVIVSLSGNVNKIQKVRNIDEIACILKTSVYVFTCSSKKFNQYIEIYFQCLEAERSLLQTIADLNEYMCNRKEHEKVALKEKSALVNKDVTKTGKPKTNLKTKRIPRLIKSNRTTSKEIHESCMKTFVKEKHTSRPKIFITDLVPLIRTPCHQTSASYLKTIKKNGSFTSDDESKISSDEDKKTISYQVKQMLFKAVENSSTNFYTVADSVIKLQSHVIRPETPDSVDTDVEIKKIHDKHYKPVIKKWKEFAARNKKHKHTSLLHDIVMLVEKSKSSL